MDYWKALAKEIKTVLPELTDIEVQILSTHWQQIKEEISIESFSEKENVVMMRKYIKEKYLINQ